MQSSINKRTCAALWFNPYPRSRWTRTLQTRHLQIFSFFILPTPPNARCTTATRRCFVNASFSAHLSSCCAPLLCSYAKGAHTHACNGVIKVGVQTCSRANTACGMPHVAWHIKKCIQARDKTINTIRFVIILTFMQINVNFSSTHSPLSGFWTKFTKK